MLRVLAQKARVPIEVSQSALDQRGTCDAREVHAEETAVEVSVKQVRLDVVGNQLRSRASGKSSKTGIVRVYLPQGTVAIM